MHNKMEQDGASSWTEELYLDYLAGYTSLIIAMIEMNIIPL